MRARRPLRSIAAIAALGLLLAACASPQQRCERAASAELRALDATIAETEEALARGYRIQPAQEGITRLRLCAWPREPVLFCTEQVQTPQAQRRAAIDRAQETARLQELRSQRAALVIQTADRIAACRSRT